jgi:hypothetical protein
MVYDNRVRWHFGLYNRGYFSRRYQMISNRIAVPIKEVEALREKCAEQIMKGGSKYSLTYEEGLAAAIDWLMGELRENPLESAGDGLCRVCQIALRESDIESGECIEHQYARQ